MIAGLPEPVARYLAALGSRPAATELAFSGSGAIHQALVGRAGLWLPLRFEARLRPGRSFVWQATARVVGIRRRAVEEYRAGRGRLAAGGRSLEGESVDRAEYALLWAWSLALAPAESARVTGVSWERVDDGTARMLFPYGAETWEATLRFDPATGLLSRFETKRYELRAGFVRAWAMELDGFADLNGRLAPTGVRMLWEEDPVTRLELEELALAL